MLISDYQSGSKKKEGNTRFKKIQKNCSFTKYNTKNGDIVINILGDNKDESITRKSSSADTGVSTSNVSEIEVAYL
jgi:hypothetical protein